MPRLAQLMRRRGLALTAALAIPLGLAIPAASATSPSQTPGA
ncbi:MAG: hypothetical protein QOG69_370, partial [Actinomycetota bacterium]|nr:hypothetical protein [Actinomycetota bacterium]